MILNAELRSLKRVRIVADRVLGQTVSTNTVGRICLDVADDLAAAEERQWNGVIDGEVPVPSVAIVEYDGGRIRTRKTDCGPGVHLEATGWNETKNAIFVSATSTPSKVDPQPDPPACFLDSAHVANIAESVNTSTNRGAGDDPDEPAPDEEPDEPRSAAEAHKPRRLLRTMVSGLGSPRPFGQRMRQEAERRRFDEAPRKAFVGDGLPGNWTIQQTHFPKYVAVLDFVHAVSHLHAASIACFGKTSAAWSAYCDWMQRVWQSDVASMIEELKTHQQRLGPSPAETDDDDPRERLRLEIGYFEHNLTRMDYQRYRQAGLPTTSAWMESAIKELNYRVKGTEMFWNNPSGAQAILRLRSAALCDDNRLVRLLTHRPGQATLRRPKPTAQAP